MDPILSPPLAAAVSKFAASASYGFIKRQLESKTLRSRLAGAIASAASKKGVPVTKKAMMGWLSRQDVKHLLLTGNASADDSALRNLAHRLEGAETDRKRKAQALVPLIIDEFQRIQRPQDAAVLANNWTKQNIEEDGNKTREDVSSLKQSVLTAVSDQDNASFNQDLHRLAPFQASRAKELAQVWSPFRRLVHELVSQKDRHIALSQWAGRTPEYWSDAPADVWCWLGEVASDCQQSTAADYFIRKGISEGAVPSDYWWARLTFQASGGPDEIKKHIQEILTESETRHPLATAHLAVMERRFTEAESIVAGWDPELPRDQTLKIAVLETCATHTHDANRAISLALQAADLGATGMMLRAAHLLLWRGLYGVSDNRMDDVVRARQLALKARDLRRQFQGDSVEATLVAVVAAMVYTDSDGAWRLLQTQPEGEALTSETSDPRMRRERLILAATTDRVDVAERLMGEMKDPYVLAMVRGWLAVHRGDEQAALSDWTTGFEEASNDAEKLQAAKALASLGGHMPDLEGLSTRQPEQVQSIRIVHNALSGPGDRLTTLRAEAHKSVELTSLLGETLVGDGQYAEAAQAYSEAAHRWALPIFLQMAASWYLKSGDYSDAVQATTEALAMAGSEWPGELSTQITRFEALMADGSIQEAINVARRMIVLAPNDIGVRWALVGALLQNGDPEGAWNSLNYNGNPIKPRDQSEALSWLRLASRYDRGPDFVLRALEVMQENVNDADALGSALMLLGLRPGYPDWKPSQQELYELNLASDRYTRDYPDSRTYRVITEGPPDDPLQGIARLVREKAEQAKQLEELRTRGARGELPLGLIADLHGKSYIEGSLHKVTSQVFSHQPEASHRGAAHNISQSLGKHVVIDGTAAVTLSLFDEKTRQQLVGQFSALLTTDSAYRDALVSKDSIGEPSTLWLGWNDREQDIEVEKTTAQEADKLARQASAVVDLLSSTKRRGWYKLKHFSALQAESAWLSALDFAVDTRHTFWCDDVILRNLAAEKGIQTFGTVDLLRELSRIGRMDPAMVAASESILIADYHVDLGFEPEIMMLAADLDGWAPLGAATSLTRTAAWEEPSFVMEFLREATSRNARSSPHNVQAWVALASTGAVRIAGNDDKAAAHNLRLIVENLMLRSWLQPDVLPYVLRGARKPLSERPKLSLPLREILTSLYEKLREQYRAEFAADFLMMWVSHLDEADRALAARIILTQDTDGGMIDR